MKAILLLFSFVVFTHCSSQIDRLVTDHHLINKINKHATWKAGVNQFFDGKTLAQAKRLLGWKPNPNTVLKAKHFDRVNVSDIPTEFDSKTQWPQCGTIGTIYNQAECGSCWAFGCVEPVSDRLCIETNGAFNQSLSFFDMVTCGPDDGCEGGDAGDAWSYVQSTGLVTATCYPYDIPTCPPAQQPCTNFVPTPSCTQQCVDSEVWSSSLHFAQSPYSVSGVEQIQTEIMTNGPVEACFDVYEDFLSYKSGVYQYTSGSLLGGHCVKMLGWGVENGQPYWLCNNSWTNYWGDDGTFKILQGQDECGIEDDIVAGMMQTSK